jgi:hypothetical protein
MKRSTISQSLQHWSSTVKLCPITRLLGEDKTHARRVRDQAVGFRLIDGPLQSCQV